MNCSDCKNIGTQICSLCCSYHGIPDRWEAKPTTNADRIRAMSDEELADFICKTQFAFIPKSLGDIPLSVYDCMSVLEWLKKEAET